MKVGGAIVTKLGFGLATLKKWAVGPSIVAALTWVRFAVFITGLR